MESRNRSLIMDFPEKASRDAVLKKWLNRSTNPLLVSHTEPA
jgi:hypothetical protein